MATTEGNSSNAFPWGVGSFGLKIQNIYDSSNFTAQGVNFPVVITRLRWRPNTFTGSVASGYPLGATVKMSTCPVDQSLVAANFAANEGVDLTTVWTGPVSWPAAAATMGPSPFLIDLPLSTPFLYDPNAGDLNIETDLPVQSSSATALQLDVQTVGSLSSRVYMSAGYPSGPINVTREHGVVVEVTYAPPAADFATAGVYGRGCYYASFYEFFGRASSFDLSNSAMTMIPAGGGYTMVPGTTSFVPPSGAATTLMLHDDDRMLVSLGSAFPFNGLAIFHLMVCSNGFVSLADDGELSQPRVEYMLSQAWPGWWIWHDFNPFAAGSGHVKFEEVGPISYITWDGVLDFSGTPAAAPSTFQFQFDRSTGAVHLVWGTMSLVGDTGFLVGYSPGGASRDPGGRDLTSALPGTFTVGPTDLAPAHASNARPVLGTSINLVTTYMPASSVVGADILSFTQYNPGIDLTALGMLNCSQYVGLDSVLVFLPVAGTGTMALSIPNNPGFAGLHVFSQGAAFVAGVNPLGALSSNGVNLKLGIN
jgi:hypothetical protein